MNRRPAVLCWSRPIVAWSGCEVPGVVERVLVKEGMTVVAGRAAAEDEKFAAPVGRGGSKSELCGGVGASGCGFGTLRELRGGAARAGEAGETD